MYCLNRVSIKFIFFSNTVSTVQKTLETMKGIITVLNTPFDTHNQLEFEGLKKNIEYAIESGIKGILVPAKAAEVEKLSFEERILMLKHTIQSAKGRVPIIAGTQSSSEEEAVKFTQEAIDLGADGILISTRYESKAQMQNYIDKFNKIEPNFIILQDWAFNDFGIPTEVLLSLFSEFYALQGIKIEVVPAGTKYSEILSLTNGKIHVSGGWAVTQMIEALERGVHAFMPTGMHELYVKIYDLFHTKKIEDAELLFRKMLPILAFSNQHLDISIHFFKHLSHKQGIYKTPNVRQPILPIDDIHRKCINKLIRYYLDLRTETINSKT